MRSLGAPLGQDVSRLGVTCVETPDGVTAESWEEGPGAIQKGVSHTNLPKADLLTCWFSPFGLFLVKVPRG